MEPIQGYESLYEIHLTGTPDGQPRVFSIGRNRYLANSVDKDGYHKVILSKDGVPKTYKIHRLVALHYINNPENLPIVDHIDGNKTNNQVQNLRWSTISANRHNSVKITGAYFDKKSNKWQSRIMINGVYKYLGLFATKSEAEVAYQNASRLYFPNVRPDFILEEEISG